jgi:hypothetical protein
MAGAFKKNEPSELVTARLDWIFEKKNIGGNFSCEKNLSFPRPGSLTLSDFLYHEINSAESHKLMANYSSSCREPLLMHSLISFAI